MDYKASVRVGCMHCGVTTQKNCTCGVPYCSDQCQRTDWQRVHRHHHALLERHHKASIGRTPEQVPTRTFPPLPKERTPKTRPQPTPKRTVWNDPNVPQFLQDALPVYAALHRKSFRDKTTVMQGQADTIQGLVRELLTDQQNRALDALGLQLMDATRRYAKLLRLPEPSTDAMSEAMGAIISITDAMQRIVANGRSTGDPGKELRDAAIAHFNAEAEIAACAPEPWRGSTRAKSTATAPVNTRVGDHMSGVPPPRPSHFGPKYVSDSGTLVQSIGKDGRVAIVQRSVAEVQAAQDRDYTAQVLDSGRWLERISEAKTLDESLAAYRDFKREFRERGEQQRISAARGVRNSAYREQQATITQAELDALDTEEMYDWLTHLLRRSLKLSRRRRRRVNVGAEDDEDEEFDEDEDEEYDEEEEEDDVRTTGFLDSVNYIWRNIKRSSGKAAYVGLMAMYITGRVLMPDLQGTGGDAANAVEVSFPLAEALTDSIGEAVDIVSVSAELGGYSALQIILEDQGDLFHAYELDRLDIDEVLESEYRMALDFPNSAELLSEFDVLYAETAISFEKYFLTLRENVSAQTGLVGEELQARTNQLMSMFTGDVAVLNDEHSSSAEQASALQRINENVRALEQAGFESMWARSLSRYADTDDLEYPQDPQAFLDKTLDALFNKAQFTNETAQRVLMSVDADEYLKLIPFPWTELPRVLAPTQVARTLRPQTTALYLQTVDWFPDNQLAGDMVFSLLDSAAGVSRNEAILRRANKALANVTLDEAFSEEYEASGFQFAWCWISWAVWFHTYSYLIDVVLPDYTSEEELTAHRVKLKTILRAREEAVELWAQQYAGGALAASTLGKLYTGVPYIRDRFAFFMSRARLTGSLRFLEGFQRTSMKALCGVVFAELGMWAASEANFVLSHSIPQYFLHAVAHDKALRGLGGDVTLQDAYNQAQSMAASLGAPDAVSWGMVTLTAAAWTMGGIATLAYGLPALRHAARAAATVFQQAESKNWRKVVLIAKLTAMLTVYRMDMAGIGTVNTGWLDHQSIDVGPQPFQYNFNAESLRQQAANEQYFAQFIQSDFGSDPMRLAAGRTVVERRFDTSFWDDIIEQAALNPANLRSPALEELQRTYYTLQTEARERLKDKKTQRKEATPPPRPNPPEPRRNVPETRRLPN